MRSFNNKNNKYHDMVSILQNSEERRIDGVGVGMGRVWMRTLAFGRKKHLLFSEKKIIKKTHTQQ